MEGPLIGGVALLLGGLATFGLAVWEAREKTQSRLWASSNRMQGWLYGAGGVVAALLGAAILIDQVG